MDDDQFHGGLSGQGGNPAPANNSNTYDFTNGDPLASMDNPEAAAAEVDPADNIAVDPLANEPIMDLTNNVNISAPEVSEEPETTAPAEEPEGPISEMSRRMDIELGNISETPADVPATPSQADATIEAAMPVDEPQPTPQILEPEAPAQEAPAEQGVETAAMSFETTDIPGQTPAPVQNDDIPSFTGEPRPSVAPTAATDKKPNKTLLIILIIVVVLIGGAVAAMMIIPNLNKGRANNNGSSSQTQGNASQSDPDDEEEEEEEEKTKVVGRAEKGYITIPATWKQILDASDEKLVRYTDEDGDFDVSINSGPISEVTAEGFTEYQLGLSKAEAKDADALTSNKATLGDFKNVYTIKYYATERQKYVVKYVFESATTNTTYFIWMECASENSSYFTSIPKSFDVVKK